MVLAIFLSVWSIHIVLSEDMEYASFTEIYDKIMLYPLNEFKYNKKFIVKKICKESLQIRFINKYVDEAANETIKKIVIEKM